jgi:hypothetical protein
VRRTPSAWSSTPSCWSTSSWPSCSRSGSDHEQYDRRSDPGSCAPGGAGVGPPTTGRLLHGTGVRRDAAPASNDSSTESSASTLTLISGGPPICAASCPSRSWVCCSSTCCNACRRVCRCLLASRSEARSGLQHGGILRHEHQLAVVLRRVDDGTSRPGGWPGGAAPPLRLGGDGRRYRAHTWIRPQPDRSLGNFWVRPGAWLHPHLAAGELGAAVVLVAGGAIQNFAGPEEISALADGTQSIPGGPVASQEAIKELGTNGGGSYNALGADLEASMSSPCNHVSYPGQIAPSD